MIPRHLQPVLVEAARNYPVVSLTGPRQSGKTTLAREVFSDYGYTSLETPETREYALNDPRGFLEQFDRGVIIDEVQRAPDIFSYIQTDVDRKSAAGQYILTGSQNFLLLDSISQSLAGRCSILHLLPFSHPELLRRPMMDVQRLGSDIPSISDEAGGSDMFHLLHTGGYPRIYDRNLKPQDWLRNYYRAYVERDVRTVLNVGDLEVFGRFTRLCAGRCGQLLNLSSLADDCGISHSTARRWLSILEASFIVTLLRPYHKNFNKRLVKSPKLFFLDTGLLCYLLRIRSPEDLRIHAARGAIFESWAISEILKNFHHRGMEPDIYFWRDSAGHEIDLIVDLDGKPTPVEIKSGQTFSPRFLDGIRYWRKISNRPQAPAVVLYGGESCFRREKVVVLSWRAWG